MSCQCFCPESTYYLPFHLLCIFTNHNSDNQQKQHTLQATRQQSQRNTDRQVNPVDLYHIEVFHSLTDVT